MPDKRPGFILIPELDAAILERLPKAGTVLGLKPLGKQVKAVAHDLREHDLSSQEISGRCRVLLARGFATQVVVQPVNTGMGWQITPAGEEFVSRVKAGTWEDQSNGNR